MYAYPPGSSFYSCKRNQNTLGALPQDPSRWLCWIRIDLRREPKINPYCAQNRSQGSRSASALSPHPLSRGGKGARMGWRLETESNALGVLGLAKTVSRKPMGMVSGAIGLHRKGGRSPPPKRGRSGGGRCAAAPYKHRLAHAPGSRCFGFPGGRSGASGFQGEALNDFWLLFFTEK